MNKIIIRFLAYFMIFMVLSRLSIGVSGTVAGFLLLSFALVVANLLIRPLVLLIALPFNLFTFGIASVFVNMLTILIADAIVASAAITGFWVMALTSVLVMVVESVLRGIRRSRVG